MATYNPYATIDTPFLILYKIGEQKSGAISVGFIIFKALTVSRYRLQVLRRACPDPEKDRAFLDNLKAR